MTSSITYGGDKQCVTEIVEEDTCWVVFMIRRYEIAVGVTYKLDRRYLSLDSGNAFTMNWCADRGDAIVFSASKAAALALEYDCGCEPL